MEKGDFNGEYKFFAEAAKESGIEDKETRKIIAEDPSLFLDEMGSEMKKRLSPKMLSDVLMTLAGSPEGVDPKSLLAVGNTLYEYRGRNGEGGEVHFEEKDRQKVDLAYILVEKALENHTFPALSKEQRAALAFTVNVMGKLFIEGKAEGLRGFDQEKFDRFVVEVEAYEARQLFKDSNIEGDHNASMENRKAILDQGIEEIKVTLNTLRSTIDPAIEEIVVNLEDALKIIKDSKVGRTDKILASYIGDLGTLVTMLRFADGRNADKVSFYFKNVITQALYHMQTEGKTDKTIYFDRNKPSSVSELFSSPFASKLYQEQSPDDSTIGYCLGHIPGMVKKLKGHLPKDEPKEGGKKTLKGFGALAELSAQSELPKAIAMLEELEKTSGALQDVVAASQKAWMLVRQKSYLFKNDDSFQKSIDSIKRERGSSAIAYAIKSILIAGDMIEGGYSGTNLLQGNPLKAQVHSFLAEAGGYPGEIKPGPAYANLHYIPLQIPFCAAAWRYMKMENAQA